MFDEFSTINQLAHICFDINNINITYVGFNKEETLVDDKQISNSIVDKSSCFINMPTILPNKFEFMGSPNQKDLIGLGVNNLLQDLSNISLNSTDREYFLEPYNYNSRYSCSSFHSLKDENYFSTFKDILDMSIKSGEFNRRNIIFKNLADRKINYDFSLSSQKSNEVYINTQDYFDLVGDIDSNSLSSISEQHDSILDDNIKTSLSNYENRPKSESSYFLQEEKYISIESPGQVYHKDESDVDIKVGTYYVGILLDKYICNEETGKEEYLCSKFFRDDNNNRTESLTININDYAIKYKKKYVYKVSSVYLLRKLSKLDNFMCIQNYLITSSKNSTNPVEIVTKLPPSHPSSFIVRYDRFYECFKLEWGNQISDSDEFNPANITGYAIFRRDSINDPYSLISVLMKEITWETFDLKYDFQKELITYYKKDIPKYFLDKTSKDDKDYIYSICSINAHGDISKYSEQIAVRYLSLENKMISDMISIAGSLNQYPNMNLKSKSIFYEKNIKPVSDIIMESNKKKIKLYFTPSAIKVNQEASEGLPSEESTSTKNVVNYSENSFTNSSPYYSLNIVNFDLLKSKNIKIKIIDKA